MRIRSFASFVLSTSLREAMLKDCPLVIDAHNFFFKMYDLSVKQSVLGCETQKYARYLKNYLSMFKRANVQCYFVFKGGNENKESFRTNYYHEYKDRDYNEFELVPPIYLKDVHKEVLDEMGFDYTICEYESKRECMALAQKLMCAVVSNDAEYCFSGIDYIPHMTLAYNQEKQCIDCRFFTLQNFLSIHHLREDVLSVLIVLTDAGIFPDGFFNNFMESQRISTHYYHRFFGLVKWLSKQNRAQALENILRFVNPSEKPKILEEEIKARKFIRPRVTPGLPTFYLTEKDTLEINKKDPQWFAKGVAADYIPMQYANLYHHALVLGAWPMQDQNENDAMLLSIDIIKYAYNLMTNYRNSKIKLTTEDPLETPISLDRSVSKPNYEADDSVFENGWREIKSLKLFEHFLTEALPMYDAGLLVKLPADVQLLMIALIYYSFKKSGDTKNVAYSVLLSYLAVTRLNKNEENMARAILDTNENEIEERDVEVASEILQKYFSVDGATPIFDEKLNYTLFEFQCCLKHLNFLNKLCGMPYKSTVYSKTYNLIFVYKILHTIESENDGNGVLFIENELKQTGTVLVFFHQLVEIYHKTLNNKHLSSSGCKRSVIAPLFDLRVMKKIAMHVILIGIVVSYYFFK